MELYTFVPILLTLIRFQDHRIVWKNKEFYISALNTSCLSICSSCESICLCWEQYCQREIDMVKKASVHIVVDVLCAERIAGINRERLSRNYVSSYACAESNIATTRVCSGNFNSCLMRSYTDANAVLLSSRTKGMHWVNLVLCIVFNHDKHTKREQWSSLNGGMCSFWVRVKLYCVCFVFRQGAVICLSCILLTRAGVDV